MSSTTSFPTTQALPIPIARQSWFRWLWRGLMRRFAWRKAARKLKVLRDSVPALSAHFGDEHAVDATRTDVPKRAIPTPGRALTELLEIAGRWDYPDLAAIEVTLRLADNHRNPLAYIRADTLIRAADQLEQIGFVNRNPELQLLRLQLRRRAGELQARAQQARTTPPPSEPEFMPTMGIAQLELGDEMSGALPGFADTAPMEMPQE